MKKAFTRFELIVICSVLALIGTISLIGFSMSSNIDEKANKDPIVLELNELIADYLKEGNFIKTVSDANLVLNKSGFDLSKLSPTTSSYHYGYNLKDNSFVILDENFDYVRGYETDDSSDVFAFVKTNAQRLIANKKGLSTYLQVAFSDSILNNVSYGLDVGLCNNVSEINVSTKSNAIIYTSSYYQNITVDSESSGVIYHYGKVGSLTLNAGSYYECGNCAYACVLDATYSLEHGANIGLCYKKSENAIINGNNISVSEANNEQIENIKNTFIKEEIANLDDINGSIYNLNLKKDYSDFASCLNDASDNDVIMLLNDINSNEIDIKKNVSIDLYGHNIVNSNNINITNDAKVIISNSMENESDINATFNVLGNARLTISQNVLLKGEDPLFIKDKAIFTLDGGSILATNCAFNLLSGNVKVLAGKVTSTTLINAFSNDGEIIISGGKFNNDPSEYLLNNYQVIFKDDGYYYVFKNE